MRNMASNNFKKISQCLGYFSKNYIDFHLTFNDVITSNMQNYFSAAVIPIKKTDVNLTLTV